MPPPEVAARSQVHRRLPAQLKGVCREFTLLCKQLDLFGGELIAIDGSKFRAVNHRDRNFTQLALERFVAGIDARIAEYLGTLDTQDAHDAAALPEDQSSGGGTDLQRKIVTLHSRREAYTVLLGELAASGDTQISLTDPDRRSMKVHGGVDVCYNVQTAVDAKHKLIVAQDVTNAPTDRDALRLMALAANAVLQATDLHAAADRGYYNGPEVVALS